MQQRGATLPKEWQTWPQDQAPSTALPRCCAYCTKFIPNHRNPTAGIGGCEIGRGNHYPMEPHNCASFRRALSEKPNQEPAA